MRARYIRLLALSALATCALCVRVASVRAADVDAERPDDLMHRVAVATIDADREIIGYHSDGLLRVDAGLYHHTGNESRFVVLEDGKMVATGLRNGSGPSFGKQAERQSHEPWGPYESEYTFERVACPECTDGTEGIAFSSTVHDALHSFGVLIVDPVRAVVVHERQTPYDFGGMAKSGTVDVDFGETDLGWRPRAVRGVFSGRVGPFSGTAHLDDMLEDYKRFPTVESAIAALSL